MATTEESLVYEAVTEKDGLKVSKSPGPGGRDRAAQLDHARDERRHPRPPRRAPRLRPQRRVLHRYAAVAAGDPGYGIWMTHTPQGSVNDNLSGVGSDVHEAYSYCGDSIHMYTHCGTHIDTLNHLGFHGKFWNGWEADRDLGSRIWNKGGLEKYSAGDRARRPAGRGRHARRGRPPRTATRSRPTTCRTPCRSRGSSSGRATSCSSGPAG